jgi:hypothetical protein
MITQKRTDFKDFSHLLENPGKETGFSRKKPGFSSANPQFTEKIGFYCA